jgi:hypothetical protein
MLRNGTLNTSVVDLALSRLLTLRFKTGLFNGGAAPKSAGIDPFLKIGPHDRGTDTFYNHALDAARQSMTLLLNKGQVRHILLLFRTKCCCVVLFEGAYSLHTHTTIPLLSGLTLFACYVTGTADCSRIEGGPCGSLQHLWGHESAGNRDDTSECRRCEAQFVHVFS